MEDLYERVERLERLQESNANVLQKLALLVSDTAAICKRDLEDVQTLRTVDTIDVLLQLGGLSDEQTGKLKEIRKSLIDLLSSQDSRSTASDQEGE